MLFRSREGLQEAWDKSSIGLTLQAVGGISAILAQRGDVDRAFEVATLVQKHPATPWKARQQAENLSKELKKILGRNYPEISLPPDPTKYLESAIADMLAGGIIHKETEF